MSPSEGTGGSFDLPGQAPELTPEQANHLKERGIVQILDGRWMRVIPTQGGGYIMSPIGITAILTPEEDWIDTADMADITEARARKFQTQICV